MDINTIEVLNVGLIDPGSSAECELLIQYKTLLDWKRTTQDPELKHVIIWTADETEEAKWLLIWKRPYRHQRDML